MAAFDAVTARPNLRHYRIDTAHLGGHNGLAPPISKARCLPRFVGLQMENDVNITWIPTARPRIRVWLRVALATILSSLAAVGWTEPATVQSPPNPNVVADAWTLTSGQADDTLRFSFWIPRPATNWNWVPHAGPIPHRPDHGGRRSRWRRRWRLRRRGAMVPCRRRSAGRYPRPPSATAGWKCDCRRSKAPRPFAVHVKIDTSDPRAKALTAVLPSKIEAPAVRLTPRPVAVAGVDTLQVDLGGTWQFHRSAAGRVLEADADSRPKAGRRPKCRRELAMQGLEVKAERNRRLLARVHRARLPGRATASS